MSLIRTLKYPAWTLWYCLTSPRQAFRNTAIVFAAFWRTVVIGRRALRVLRRHSSDCPSRKGGAYWSDDRRGRYIWRVAHRFWAPWILERAGLRVQIVGLERVDWLRPSVMVANHQSTLDVLVLVVAVTNAAFVAKKEILPYPIVGRAAQLGGQVVIDREARAEAMAAIRRVLPYCHRRHLIFFAEGSRSRDGRLGPFKAGGFVTAIESGRPIVPIAISGSFEALPKGSLLRLDTRPILRIEFGSMIAAAGCERSDVAALRDETRDVIAEMLAG